MFISERFGLLKCWKCGNPACPGACAADEREWFHRLRYPSPAVCHEIARFVPFTIGQVRDAFERMTYFLSYSMYEREFETLDGEIGVMLVVRTPSFSRLLLGAAIMDRLNLTLDGTMAGIVQLDEVGGVI
jgi:hypothetical protein